MNIEERPGEKKRNFVNSNFAEIKNFLGGMDWIDIKRYTNIQEKYDTFVNIYNRVKIVCFILHGKNKRK